MYRAFLHYNDLWVFRKRFAAQMAAVSFLTYVMGIGQRHPHKMFISKATGNVFPMDIQLGMMQILDSSPYIFAHTYSQL